MSQIGNGTLPKKQIQSCTEEEIKKWDWYARMLADKIAYDEFRGIPHFFILRTSSTCRKGDY